MAKDLPETDIGNSLRDIANESSLNKAERVSLRAIAKEYDKLCKAYEGLVALLKEFRNCEICKYGRENMPFKKDEHWHKHCEFCESGEDNNWELAEQALSEEKQDD